MVAPDNVRNRGNSTNEVIASVKLDKIPKFSDLKAQVDKVVNDSSWWDLYGVDWAIIFVFFIIAGFGIVLLGSYSWPKLLFGAFLLGWFHNCLFTKSGHISAHGGLCQNKKWRRLLAVFFLEFIGQFSEELTYDAHIREHHTYTNIIGMGDSSTWKIPFLPTYVYMFFAPLLLPVITPFVAIAGLVEKRSAVGIIKFIVRAGSGLGLLAYILMKVSDYSLAGALLVIWLSRATLSVPWVHVNIFQHIGLPMYSKENKPVRLYQMATGVLNLPSNLILDYAMGHAIISCHVEHHLFPNLSDNMCLKVKPVVSRFLKENGLPYNERTYTNRLMLFLKDYKKLMVNAPPITHFVGIQ